MTTIQCRDYPQLRQQKEQQLLNLQNNAITVSLPASRAAELPGCISSEGKHDVGMRGHDPAVPLHHAAEPHSVPQPGHGAFQQTRPHRALAA